MLLKTTFTFDPHPDASLVPTLPPEDRSRAGYAVKYALTTKSVDKYPPGTPMAKMEWAEGPDLNLPFDCNSFYIEAEVGTIVDCYVAWRSAQGILSQAVRLCLNVQIYPLPMPIQNLHVAGVKPVLKIVDQEPDAGPVITRPKEAPDQVYCTIISRDDERRRCGVVTGFDEEGGRVGVMVTFDEHDSTVVYPDDEENRIYVHREVDMPDHGGWPLQQYIEIHKTPAAKSA